MHPSATSDQESQTHPPADLPPSGSHFCIQTSFGSAVIADAVPREDHEVWVAGWAGYPMDHRYYEIVHESLKDQFGHYYLLLKDASGMTRAIQPFLIVSQDLATGTPTVFRRLLANIRSRFPGFLKVRMLMVGCSAGEGDIAVETQSRDIAWTIDALKESLAPVARRLKAMLIVFKDFPKTYRRSLDRLQLFGFTRVPSMPATKLDLNFPDFEAYLKTRIGYTMRKNLRRKFRKTEGRSITCEVVADISPYVEEIYPLYRQTFDRSELKFEELTKSYLCELGRRMGDRVRFLIWRLEGRIIAFASTIVHQGVLRDNYIGLDYSVALEYHLYFVTWRDTIIWALENGIHTYHSAPLNYDPKYHFRMELEPLDLYVRAPSGWLNTIFKRILPLLEPTRYDPVIGKFANAQELWQGS
ncbi:MAG: GNAT family N-acetyltransferase [Verrucomicrobia bacterium]|nr:GNAT family N-acetyltransferase [Verrucomicrobiota bacterium]